MARVPLSGSASPRLSPGGVREPPVGHMPFLLILVVALLFGLTPTAVGASVVSRLDGTLRVAGGNEINNVSISSTGPFSDRHIRVEDSAARGDPSSSDCTPDPVNSKAVSCRSAGVRDEVTPGGGNDTLTISGLDSIPRTRPRLS